MRLIAGMRHADSVLFFETAYTTFSVDLEKRHMPDSKGADDMWLRLPCRTILGRADDFTQAKAALGGHAGPLLSCPSPEEDFTRLEALAAHPDMFIPRPVEPAENLPEEDVESAQPSEQEKAVQDMAENPDAVEPILKAAAEKNDAAVLDYALFIHAFRPATPENKERIIQLLDPVIQAVAAENPNSKAESLDAYDGTDLSLASILRVLSVEGEETWSYTIPCAVLIARPDLIEATVGYYIGTRDNFVPRSGCKSNKGYVKDFPIDVVKNYINIAKYADGHFIDNHNGTLVYSHIATMNSFIETLKINPSSYVDDEYSSFDYPYQTWGMTGAVADEIAKRIRLTYREAREALTAYNVRHGLSPEDAALAAKQGLFHIVFGARCGGGVPERSIRDMLIKGAPVKAILAQRQLPDGGEAPEVLKCADYATLDPLLHVAVLHPAALSALLDQGEDIEQPNPIGKTPLMTAAHLDRLSSVARLLMRGARVEAMTLSPQRDDEHPQLKHDARSPLMYAASSGSLATITLLLDAGADPYRADSKGRRAIDYLLGYGPVQANPLLSDEERAEAVRRLF